MLVCVNVFVRPLVFVVFVLGYGISNMAWSPMGRSSDSSVLMLIEPGWRKAGGNGCCFGSFGKRQRVQYRV